MATGKLRDFNLASAFAAIGIESDPGAQAAVTRIVGMLWEVVGNGLGLPQLQLLARSGEAAEMLRRAFVDTMDVSIDIDALDEPDCDLSQPILADTEKNAALFGGATGGTLESFFRWLRELELDSPPPAWAIWPNNQYLPFNIELSGTYVVEGITLGESSDPDRPAIFKIRLADGTEAGSDIVYIRSDHPELGDLSDIVDWLKSMEAKIEEIRARSERAREERARRSQQAALPPPGPAHAPLVSQLPGLVPAQTDPNDGAALSAAVGRIVGLLQGLGPEEARRALRQVREELHPAHVSLRAITERPDFERLLDFFRAASSTGQDPARSYEQLVAIIESVGLTAAEILSELPEERWITPSPLNQNRQPGANRHTHAWTVFLNIVKQLSQVCACGTSCPQLVDISAFPDAFGLSGLHFDHNDPSQKAQADKRARATTVIDMLKRIGSVKSDESDARAAAAVAELLQCTLLCASCHDLGENSGGAAREKRRPQPVS